MLLLVCHGSLILIEKYNQKNYWTQNYRLVLGSYKYQDRFFCSVLSDSLLKINHEIDVSRCFKMPRSRDQEIIELLSSLCIPGSAKQYWTNTCTTGEIYLFQSIWVALNLLFWSANSHTEYQEAALFFHYKHITIKVVKQYLQTLDNGETWAWSIKEGIEARRDAYHHRFLELRITV